MSTQPREPLFRAGKSHVNQGQGPGPSTKTAWVEDGETLAERPSAPLGSVSSSVEQAP